MMGAIWRKEWIMPYESAWSIFEKFIYANVIERKELLKAMGNEHVKKIKGTHIGNRFRDLLTLNGFDAQNIHNYMKCNLHQITRDTIQKLLHPLSEENADIWFSKSLRWCNDCLQFGYHSLIHQFVLFNTCPFHCQPLINFCPKCHTEIPFLLSDISLSDAFTCKCGYVFADMSTRWEKWNSTLEILDPSIMGWIGEYDNTLKKDKWLYIPKYVDFQTLSNRVFTQQNNVYRLRPSDSTLNSDDNLLHDISKNNRQIFKSVDKYLRKKLLYKHKACIKRLQYMLKRDGENFLPICPCAYAYVFWKQSLLDLPQFYGTVNGLQKGRGSYKPDFHMVAPIFKEQLKQLFDKATKVPRIMEEPTKGAIKWILNTASAYLYLRFFSNWLEFAEEGARLEQAPRKDMFHKIVNSGIRFVFHYSEDPIEGSTIQFIDNKNSLLKEKISSIKCKKMRSMNRQMRSFTPIAVSMMSFDDRQLKKELQVYVDQYVAKLCL
ncbi:TniQ family protein [Paenibacillus elgii]|uniref:TniQ family protein n=1 Tax=Paenibacillus elgii TaxID=189691 RepID=UPI0002F7A90D|nr:TniQ family protein [Paenibacillus elgii]